MFWNSDFSDSDISFISKSFKFLADTISRFGIDITIEERARWEQQNDYGKFTAHVAHRKCINF